MIQTIFYEKLNICFYVY